MKVKKSKKTFALNIDISQKMTPFQK